MITAIQRLCGIRILCCLASAMWMLTAQVPSSGDELPAVNAIVTAAEVKALPAKDAELKQVVELRGVVTAVPEGWKGFFLEDATGGIYCEPQNLEAEKSFWPVRVGEEITLHGVSARGHRNSFVSVSAVVSRQAGILPQPKLQTLPEVINNRIDADVVRVSGHIVGLINIAGEMEYGLLADGIEAQVVHSGFRIDPKVFELSKVEICGVVIPQETNVRRVKIMVPDAQYFKMLATHLQVLAATPKETIQEIVQRNADRGPLVRISGDIYCRDKETTWLVEKGFGVDWRSNGVLLPEGTRHVELLGMLKRDGARRWVEYGTVLSATDAATESPAHQDSDSATVDAQVNQIVTLTATFWDANAFNSEIVLSFDVGNSKLTCRVLSDSADSSLPQLQRGAEYEVTGLLNAVSSSKLEARELLVRSLSDVVQISGPPWPLRFTLIIVSILSVGLALGLVTASISWRQASLARVRLENVRNELRFVNESLEARVATRTSELDQSNRRLRDEATARLEVEKDRTRTLVCLEEAQSIAQMGSFVWDAITNTSVWSKQCYVIHGLDPSGRAPDLNEYCSQISEADQNSFEVYLEQAVASSEREEHRYRIMTSDGQVRWLRSLIGANRDPNGTLTSIDGVIQDVTDLVSTEEQLRHSMKMEVAGRLAGGIAHDLNNTLTIIQLNCFLLDTELRALAASRNVLNHVVAIENASEKSAMLTRQLLTFSRKQIVRPVELNINTTLQAFSPLLKQLLGDTIDLEIQLAERIADIRLDPGQLEQIVMNLVLNARDAITDKGEIQVQTQTVFIERMTDLAKWALPPRKGEYISIRVSDNGSGIGAESLHTIFEPFFSTKGPDKGTGLGLAVVHGIVRQNNGGLLVESVENSGTTFQVLIPVARHTDSQALGAERRIGDKLRGQPALLESEHGESILLVDDELAVGRYTENVLRRLGYSVTTTNSPQAALQLVKDGGCDFQLLVTDYSMPYLSGTELAKKIREYLPTIPVILMSGFLNEEAFQNLPVELNPIYIQKPFSIQNLSAAVRKSLIDNEAVPRAAG